jgi:tetratricopeptide (TPR) repeat protein
MAGDLENALQEYNSAFQQSNDAEEKALALYGKGRVYMEQRDYPSAIDALTHILGQFAGTTVVADAHYLLGQCYSFQEDYQQAANSYAQFLALKPGIIDAHVLLLQAEASSNAGDHYGAIYALQKSVQSEPAADSTEVNLKIGKEYTALQDYTTAIQYYLSAYDTATNDTSALQPTCWQGRLTWNWD